MRKKIRVGLIRCDTHGMFFGPLFQPHDPMRLRLPVLLDKPATDSWMRGGNHAYFYSLPGAPTQMTVPMVDGLELVKLWDEDRRTAEVAAEVFHGKPMVCDRFEDVSDGVDLVFIADCNHEGKDHLKLATPGLKKGIPTFVDKPFSYTVADARTMLKLADRHKAPILSLSILRVSPAAARFRNRLDETGGVNFGSIEGGGTGLQGLIHSISLAQQVFGPGVRTVRVLNTPKHTSLHLDYGGHAGRPKHGVAIHCDVGATFHGAMYVSAVGPWGKIDSGELGSWEHPYGAIEILKLARQMAITRKSPVPREEILECIAVAEAFRKARDTSQPVNPVRSFEKTDPSCVP